MSGYEETYGGIEVQSEGPTPTNVITKPSHYTSGKTIEPIRVIEDWGLDFNLGQVIRYISRAGLKDDLLQDLKKARAYLTREITTLEGKPSWD